MVGKEKTERYPPDLLPVVSIGKASIVVQGETGTHYPDDVPLPEIEQSVVV